MNSIIKLFKALSLETRMNMILELSRGELSVNQIAEGTGMEQSHVSHHLKQMKESRIVTCRLKGKKRMYSLNADTIEPIIAFAQLHVNAE